MSRLSEGVYTVSGPFEMSLGIVVFESNGEERLQQAVINLANGAVATRLKLHPAHSIRERRL